MSTPLTLTSSGPQLLAALRHRAHSTPQQAALRFRRLGAWRSQTWAQFARLVDDITAVWQGLGIGNGATVALVGPLSEASLATALGVAALGGHVVLGRGEAQNESGRSPDALLLDGAQDLAGLAAHELSPVVVVRQADGVVTRSDARLHLLDALLGGRTTSHAPTRPTWPGQLFRGVAGRGGPPSLLVSGLQSEQVLHAVLNWWLTQAAVLALPEPHGHAHLDRVALQPEWAIDTACGHEQWATDVEARWPSAACWQGRVLARACCASSVEPPSSIPDTDLSGWGFESGLRARVRRQLGLSNARGVWVDGTASPAVHMALGRLGLSLSSLPTQALPCDWPVSHQAGHGSGQLSLSGTHDGESDEIPDLGKVAS